MKIHIFREKTRVLMKKHLAHNCKKECQNIFLELFLILDNYVWIIFRADLWFLLLLKCKIIDCKFFFFYYYSSNWNHLLGIYWISALSLKQKRKLKRANFDAKKQFLSLVISSKKRHCKERHIVIILWWTCFNVKHSYDKWKE